MKKTLLLFFILSLFVTGFTHSSYATTTAVKSETDEVKTITLVIDGKDVMLDCIIKDEQLFLAINELAPALDMTLEANVFNKPMLTSNPENTVSYGTTQLDFTTTVLSNNSVGSDWYYYIQLQNHTYNLDDQSNIITLNGDNLGFELVAYEYDKEASDYGRTFLVVPYSELAKGMPLTYTETVKVVEDGGEYSGNVATIEFNVTLTPMQ